MYVSYVLHNCILFYCSGKFLLFKIETLLIYYRIIYYTILWCKYYNWDLFDLFRSIIFLKRVIMLQCQKLGRILQSDIKCRIHFSDIYIYIERERISTIIFTIYSKFLPDLHDSIASCWLRHWTGYASKATYRNSTSINFLFHMLRLENLHNKRNPNMLRGPSTRRTYRT
jgi:hypothetical protein